MLLQSFYSDLMGDRFYYYFGILDPPCFDLFLWFVLCHRSDMAMIFWRECNQCMLTAIGAAVPVCVPSKCVSWCVWIGSQA